QQEGFLALQVSPWARVFINGRFYETTPLEKPIALAPGRYQLELIHEAYQTWRDSIEITPRQILRRDVKLVAKP
ncbi:MAG: PEGA domain-containing protein, partial [Calditrichaeota bacterium]|nr:PEGA domain-containing protein [Calditrichota bacterium]